MQYVTIGNTGVKVSRLCFGTLQMGSLMAQIPPIQAAELLVFAFEKGITLLTQPDPSDLAIC